jgi:EAL domain-containing protein (putative c-di-GMP-specific phosphodiesterase class I)/CheY-like chemotaxis protein
MVKSSRPLRILVIDDEPVVADLIAQLLRELGVSDVQTAVNGEHALQMLTTGDVPDIICCDLNMPGMDGIQFIRHLADRGLRSGLIVVSGEDSRILTTVKDLAHSHGIYVLGVLSKPIALESLVRMLRAYESGPPDKGAADEDASDVEPITEQELIDGLASDAVFVVFQPKVELVGGAVRGVEALARWRHARRGILPPAAFVPLAEDCGRIWTLTDRVFREAMAHGAAWRAAGLDLSVSVNFATSDLERLDLPEYIVSCARGVGMDPSKVIVEVTESRIMKNFKASLEILSRLRMKGVGLSIDDFGTGYSSMEQLRRAPFTEIKVDRAFVSGASHDRKARTILESSIRLGKDLGLTSVAEGAETRRDWDLLESLGCGLVQGFFVAEPMDGREVEGWIRQWRPPGAK